ncbi:hypothetical protein RUND412_009455, partial [Rhizina undulata]
NKASSEPKTASPAITRSSTSYGRSKRTSLILMWKWESCGMAIVSWNREGWNFGKRGSIRERGSGSGIIRLIRHGRDMGGSWRRWKWRDCYRLLRTSPRSHTRLCPPKVSRLLRENPGSHTRHLRPPQNPVSSERILGAILASARPRIPASRSSPPTGPNF